MSIRTALFASLLGSAAPEPMTTPDLGLVSLDAPSLLDGDHLVLDALVRDTERLLAGAGIDGRVTARIKSPASTLAKMRRKGVGPDDIFDRLALRIRVDTVEDCYAVRSLIEARHRVIAAERDDYIASPKANGYRSLHSAVRTHLGEVAEFQVRTHAMHEQAERGSAAHWLYKAATA